MTVRTRNQYFTSGGRHQRLYSAVIEFWRGGVGGSCPEICIKIRALLSRPLTASPPPSSSLQPISRWGTHAPPTHLHDITVAVISGSDLIRWSSFCGWVKGGGVIILESPGLHHGLVWVWIWSGFCLDSVWSRSGLSLVLVWFRYSLGLVLLWS